MKINEIQPIGKKVIVDSERPDETSSGLISTEMGKTTPVTGKVLKAGNESAFKEGDIVFFRRYSVDELKFTAEDGTEITLNLVEDEDIVAKVLPANT